MTTRTLEGTAGPIEVNTWGPADSPNAPVLLVHGAHLRGRAWSDIVELLPQDRLYVAPDLRGHGDSTRDGVLDVEHWAEDCAHVRAELELRPAHVVGNSMGAAIAVALIARDAEAAVSLATVGGAFLPVTEGSGVDDFAAAVAESGTKAVLRAALPRVVLAPGAASDLADRVAADQSDNAPTIAVAIERAADALDARPYLSGLHCPILAVTGDLDTIVPVSEAEWFARETGARLELIAGAGHLPTYEAPRALADLLATHIQHVDSASVTA